MTSKTKECLVLAAACLSVLVMGPLRTASAEEIEDTAQAHLAKADEYARKAAAFRQDAEAHRKMKREYHARVVSSPKGGPAKGWYMKMDEHCDAYINDAERLAADAEQLAAYHRMRGHELQGH